MHVKRGIGRTRSATGIVYVYGKVVGSEPRIINGHSLGLVPARGRGHGWGGDNAAWVAH